MRVLSQKVATLAFALTVGLAGCASGGGASSRPPGATPDRIVQEEFLEVGDMGGYAAIQRLRSAWLRVRNNVEPPVVYVNDQRWGSFRDLDSVPARGIAEAVRVNATDATTRFGMGHTGGAIMIRMSGL